MVNYEGISDNGGNEDIKWKDVEDAAGKMNISGEQRERSKEIKINKLSHEDVERHPDQLAEALYLIDQYIFPDLFQDEYKAAVFAKELFSDDENALFSYNKTLVAKDEDGNIAGILVYRDEKCTSWDTDAVRERFLATGMELPDNFERANEQYMKKVTDAELPEGAAEIEFVGVRDDYRGRHIGKDLMNQVIENPQYKEVHLDVLDSHPTARHRYDGMGFKPDGDKFGNYPDNSEWVQHMILRKAE